MNQSILSVGIDVGTTTSQIIFSRLTIENRAAVSRVPQINITNKEIVYRSPIYFTPLINSDMVDQKALAEIVRTEFKQAGIEPKDVTVGAVIITGESSRKENSQEIVHALGDLAGDFVVASAGPDLEGIIAGRGAGAAKISQEKKCIVANVDIGGGTSNIAVFDDGVPIDTACLDIGGRQIRFKPGTTEVEYIAPKTQQLCRKLGLDIQIGRNVSPSVIEILCKKYSEIICQALGFLPQTEDIQLMLTDHELASRWNISYVTFSGGVADAFYFDTSLKDPLQYNDIGVIFGQVLKKNIPDNMRVLQSSETIRATVIGAGVFTASLSGSTVDSKAEYLPLKNLPIIKFSRQEELLDLMELSSVIEQKIDWIWDPSIKGIVLAFTFDPSTSYEMLQLYAEALVRATEKIQKNHSIVVVIIENDFAKALGQIIRLKKSFPLIVLDSIRVQDGDYIDIGNPLMDNKVVPVVVKSLIFNK